MLYVAADKHHLTGRHPSEITASIPGSIAILAKSHRAVAGTAAQRGQSHDRYPCSQDRNGRTRVTTAALDVATGFVIGKCFKRHRTREFLDFLKRIDRLYEAVASPAEHSRTRVGRRRRLSGQCRRHHDRFRLETEVRDRGLP